MTTITNSNPSVFRGVYTSIHEGVTVDAAPAWDDGLIMSDNETKTLETGLNLIEDVDHILISFTRNVDASGADLWPCPVRRVRIKDIELGIAQGMLISHFDNQFLAVDITTQAELASGSINFKAESQSGVFGYEITRIEFRRRAEGSSPLIGFKLEGPPNLENEIKGVKEIYERTIVNGAADNPRFAELWPSLVNGPDLVFPSTLEGAFSRNLGGRASGFETFQNHAQARSPNNPVSTQVNGGGGNTVRSIDTSAGETRPANYAMQWYFIMDDYVDPTSTGSNSPSDLLNSSVANMTTQIESPSSGTDLVMDTFTSLSGGITLNPTGDVFTLPQSDIPYSLKAIIGFDFDGSPVGAWEVEWFSDGAVVSQNQEAQFRVFASGGHSQPEYYNPSSTAIVDASEGPVEVSLRVTTGGTSGVDITRAFVEIEQKPSTSVVVQPNNTYEKIGDVHIKDDGDGFVRMWGAAANVDSVSLPVEVLNISECEVHITTKESVERHIQPRINASTGTTLELFRSGNTAASFNWSVYGQKA